jgi:hypothetical protein
LWALPKGAKKMTTNGTFAFRLTDGERAKVEWLAKSWNVSPGKVMRHLIHQANERTIPPSPSEEKIYVTKRDHK